MGAWPSPRVAQCPACNGLGVVKFDDDPTTGQRCEACSPNYADFFYELADILGIQAQPISPQRVWEEQIRPRIAALLTENQSLRRQLAHIPRSQDEGGVA